MDAAELATRLQFLNSAPRAEKAQLSQALSQELTTLDVATLGDLLCLCENVLEPRTLAKTARTLLCKALEGKPGLSVQMLLRGGISLSTLVQLARGQQLADIPPAPSLADELLAVLLGWQPQSEDGGGAGKGRVSFTATRLILGAVRHLGLVALVPESAAEALLRHAASCEPKRLSGRQVFEAGDLVPEWRPLLLRLLLAENDCGLFQVAIADQVKVAQRWGAHEDPAVFARLRKLLERADGKEADDNEGTTVGSVPNILPALRIEGEQLVLVDSEVGEAKLAQVVLEAAERLRRGGSLWVGLDAEWEDPRPLSLVQLAVGSSDDKDGVTVILLDMVSAPSADSLERVRWLLRSTSCSAGVAGLPELAADTLHEVLAFGAHEDKRRLAVSGLLPELGQADDCKADEDSPAIASSEAESDVAPLGWIDLQHHFARGLGGQPSLKAVVAKELGMHLDKTLQRSHWDLRPLSQAQLEYAALDASVLLRLRRRCHAVELRKPQQTASEARAKKASQADSRSQQLPSREEEQVRWSEYRLARGGSKSSAPVEDKKELNGDLRFILPSSLARLMRKMRGVGLDTLILDEGAPLPKLGRLAVEEDRIVLTRSRKMQLAGEAAARIYFLRGEDTDDQLRELIDVFGVEVDPDCLCGRCVQCNTWDWRFASRDDVRDNPQVSEKTLAAFSEFWACGGCGKIFWEGGMFEKAVAHFRTFLPEEAGIGSPSAIEATAGQAKNDCASDAVANSPAGLPLLSHDQVREKLDKYEEMGLNGCSAQRIRGQMVRDGILVPGVSDSDPLTLPFLASFANGKSVTAVSISEGGTTLTWANVLCTPGQVESGPRMTCGEPGSIAEVRWRFMTPT
ncbi:unnamed protein product [Polarella glacialis]|uniref:3'-5' exonuclease domain-containing protein n=1 Tax=Polarella glacialis TaxID=89957 RepID=A0A813I9J9_POLGL|nr:unnamed protein product [Polarella glacialis]